MPLPDYYGIEIGVAANWASQTQIYGVVEYFAWLN